jgi:hypothetical protein
MRDDRVDAGLNATLDTGSVKILFAIFVPGPTTPASKSLLSRMWRTATPAPQYLQPPLAFTPKAS